MAKVLITGTSKGIGYEATLLLARAGHEVVATMRDPGASDLEKVVSEAKLPVTVLQMDVDDDASVVEVFRMMGDSIDVLVNNAGIYSINVVEDEDLDQFRRVMETNYFGAVRCVKQVLPAMRKRGAGRIINVSSIAGRIAFSSTSAYNASKFALRRSALSVPGQEVQGGESRCPGGARIIDSPMATRICPVRRKHAHPTAPDPRILQESTRRRSRPSSRR